MKNNQHIFTSATLLLAFTLTTQTFASNFSGTITYQGEKIPVFKLPEVEINTDDKSSGLFQTEIQLNKTNTLIDYNLYIDKEVITLIDRNLSLITIDQDLHTSQLEDITVKKADEGSDSENTGLIKNNKESLKKRPVLNYITNKSLEIGSKILQTLYDGLFFRS